MPDLSDELLLQTLSKLNDTVDRLNVTVQEHAETLAIIKAGRDGARHWQIIASGLVGGFLANLLMKLIP